MLDLEIFRFVKIVMPRHEASKPDKDTPIFGMTLWDYLPLPRPFRHWPEPRSEFGFE